MTSTVTMVSAQPHHPNPHLLNGGQNRRPSEREE
jgi:hypothetical protein